MKKQLILHLGNERMWQISDRNYRDIIDSQHDHLYKYVEIDEQQEQLFRSIFKSYDYMQILLSRMARKG